MKAFTLKKTVLVHDSLPHPVGGLVSYASNSSCEYRRIVTYEPSFFFLLRSNPAVTALPPLELFENEECIFNISIFLNSALHPQYFHTKK